MKLSLLGGGGFRTPLVYWALLDRADRLRFDELVLYDLEERRLERIAAVLVGMQQERGVELAFRLTTDLEDAVEGADFVFCAIRVGGLEGRLVDETVPLEEGVLGQETTGAGGIGFALRTVPVMVEIAEVVARLAPHAWFVNFTNPAGLVTEALQRVLGTRAIGICDGPPSLCSGVAHALGRKPEQLSFDYFGLNHLGWLRAVYDDQGDRLPELLADDGRLATFAEGKLFGANLLRSLRMIPMEYLYYYYHAKNAIDTILKQGQTRAEFLFVQQKAFYERIRENPGEALESWRSTGEERSATYMAETRLDASSGDGIAEDNGATETRGGYEGVALALVESMTLNTNAILILNTANRSSLPFLDAAAVVEVPCVVSANGVLPVALGDAPLHARGLIETIKDVERLTIEAALTRSPELAVQALALHPLVPSVDTARRIFARYVEGQPALQQLFSSPN